MNDLYSAFAMLAQFNSVIALLIGIVGGIIIGVIPGLGPSIAIAMAIPFTLNMELAPSIALLMGLYCASIYGGAITAIIVNVPGTPASAATALDGYPMAKRGDGDIALTVATLASGIGGFFSLIILMLLAPILAAFALRFGPIEMCLVALFALVCIIMLDRKIIMRAMIAALIGILLAMVGPDPVTGATRLTFGVFLLSAGVPLVPLLIGLFAITEVVFELTSAKSSGAIKFPRIGVRLPEPQDRKRTAWVVFKSSIIGTAVGILPGAGPTAASFVSYSEAKRSSPHPETFGKGNAEGVAASESANNAVVGGALVPSLSLGIPGDPITALILAALVLQGVIPGPRLYVEHYDMVLYILITLFIANLGIIVFGLMGTHLWTRVLQVPTQLLMAGVVVFATIGTFSVNNSLFDLYLMVGAGLLGVLLRLAAIPVTPLIIGFVLGPLIEINLRQSMILYGDDWLVFWHRPIAGGILLVTLAIIFLPVIKRLLTRRMSPPEEAS
ncbi:tripartite tricarboxylate transporter permease [Mesorhizobium sp. A556]